MAKNFIQRGDIITIPAPAPVASGGVVITGQIAGVALGDAAAAASVDVAVAGVFRLPKVAADAIALGAPVYWDSSDALVTGTGTGNAFLGVAVEAAAAATGTVAVRLGTICSFCGSWSPSNA